VGKDVSQPHARIRTRRPKGEAGLPVSIKVRVRSGCFHREHSPHAYKLIDSWLARLSRDVEFVEHESGPELLVFLAVATAGITLTKSVLDLITAIIKARSEGIKKGDHPSEPIELIVRRANDGDEYRKEIVLRISCHEKIDSKAIQKAADAALRNLEGN
jgi:hypothetical protein